MKLLLGFFMLATSGLCAYALSYWMPKDENFFFFWLGFITIILCGTSLAFLGFLAIDFINKKIIK